MSRSEFDMWVADHPWNLTPGDNGLLHHDGPRLGFDNPDLSFETKAAVKTLARLLIERLAVPESQPRDALHISIAAVHGVEFIATWNFKHILNPHLQLKIADTCREGGFQPPIICTPQQLLETENDSGSN